jgi:hypothetical protein
MGLSASKITSAAMRTLESKGFVTGGEHSKQSIMVEAIVEALIDGIKADAQVVVTGGSSAGSYKVA